jgi:XisI protein
MDTKLKYETAILSFLGEYAQIKPINFKNANNQVIVDRDNGHYQLVRMGWQGEKYIYNTVFHFDLVGTKILVQQNRTDLSIVEELEEFGISSNDIVVSFAERAIA